MENVNRCQGCQQQHQKVNRIVPPIGKFANPKKATEKNGFTDVTWPES